MSFDLHIYAGGYWSRDQEYVGGQPHNAGRFVADAVRKGAIITLLTTVFGYEDNMAKVAWFNPESPEAPVELEDDDGFRRAAHYGISAGALTLYVVRVDDPYLETRMVPFRSLSEDEVGDEETSASAGACDGGAENETEAEANGEGSEDGGGENIEAEEGEIDCYDSENSEGGRDEVDERKYKDFTVGQIYRTIDSFKSALSKYAVKKKKNIKYKKSDSSRVLAVCDEKDCQWKIYASINSSSERVVVRSLGPNHTCTWCGTVRLLTSTRIAEMFIEDFRENPNLSGKELQKKLMKKNIYLSWTKCERSRLKCLAVFDKEQEEQFGRLHDYVYELKRSNPGSTVECEVRQSVFHRFYICFAGLKDGWKAACRRIIHVDGTFLKWRMSGMLLVACGRDPNDQMFPIAWGVVDVESKDSWLWFFEHLAEDLDLGTGNGLTLASDQQKGLIGAVKELLPYAEHRMCARHVHACWKRRHSGSELQDLFWAAADAYYPLAFDRKMKELHEFDPVARADLKISPFYPWSR